MEIEEYACGCFYVQNGFNYCPNFEELENTGDGKACYEISCPYLRVNGKYLSEGSAAEQYKP